MLEEFRQEGLEEPQFEDMGTDFRVIFKRKVFDNQNADANETKVDTNNETVNDTNQCCDANTWEMEEASFDKRVFLAMQKDKNITVNKLVELLRTSRSTVLRSIKRLKDGGRVRRLGGNRRGEWAVVEI
jgi:ATP-dependent DNA helicase RecG